LTEVNALLGCPLVMFPLELLQDAQDVNQLHELPASVSAAVLTSLQAASSYLREVLNCFAPTAAEEQQRSPSQGSELQAKLSRRVAQLAQLEALAAALADNLQPP
ncbi:hypothetical protein Agub_g10954, partial [Astrephomene gubernaculifera]